MTTRQTTFDKDKITGFPKKVQNNNDQAVVSDSFVSSNEEFQLTSKLGKKDQKEINKFNSVSSSQHLHFKK